MPRHGGQASSSPGYSRLRSRVWHGRSFCRGPGVRYASRRWRRPPPVEGVAGWRAYRSPWRVRAPVASQHDLQLPYRATLDPFENLVLNIGTISHLAQPRAVGGLPGDV